MDHDFNNQTILITGGTGALGSMVTQLFSKYLPKVIIVTYRSESERSDTEKALRNQSDEHDGDKSRTEIKFVQVDLLNLVVLPNQSNRQKA